MKKIRILILSFALVLCSACSSSGQKPDAQQMQTFFTAINRLMEAKTLSTNGKLSSGNFHTSFQLWIDQEKSPMEAAVIAGGGTAQEVAFFLKDGKTYLNYMGTKSQSVAENLGITKDTKLSFYNPFLDLNDEQKMEMFDSVSIQGNEYTFKISKDKLSSLLDSFGSITLSRADLKAVVEDGQIKSLSFDIIGSLSMGKASSSVSGTLELNDIQINEPLNIPWPSDLNSWPKQ